MTSIEQAREALKLCPFCGGTNVKTFGPVGWYRTWGISHSCKSFYSGTSEMFQGFHTEAEAIAAWNRRSPASDHEIDRFGMIDEASGHEQLYWGRTNDIQPWGVSGEEYVRYSDHVAVLAGLSRVSPSTPVDGVGAEPGNVAWAKVRIDTVPDEHGWCSCTPYNKHPVDVAKGLVTDEWNERGQFFGQVSLASPEAEARLRDELAIQTAAARKHAKALFAAEARLRERVTEAERLRFEGELDKWMKIIGAGITGYQPEAYAVMDAACRELVSLRKRGAEPVIDGWMSGADFIGSYYGDDDEPPVAETNPPATGAEASDSPIDAATDVACGVGNTYGGDVLSGEDRAVVELGIRRLVGAGWTVAAEARLAQAEGGPAVTEAQLIKAWTDFLDANPDDLTSPDDLPNHALMTGDQFVQYASAALEAALHPQSAAGEEGK